MLRWLADNWLDVVLPLLAFLATFIVGMWLRRVLLNALDRWSTRTKWKGSRLLVTILRRAFLFWFLLLGIFIGIEVSILSVSAKAIAEKALGSLLVISLEWVAIILTERLVNIYFSRFKMSRQVQTVFVNVIGILFVVIGILIILDIWGVQTTPLILLVAVIVLGAALALRNVAPDIFAGLQLSASQNIKEGDYIKLESGEEGYVTDISLSNTRIKALNESTVVIPNSRLLQHAITNFGHPVKKAKEPFHFYSRVHLTELTGLSAKNLNELVELLKKVPESVIYYHTHRFLEQHHYLTPEPTNDFAMWVSDTLGDDILGERLASVDTFQFTTLDALRERLVGITEEYLTTAQHKREASSGEEFYFMKSISFILPTPYLVHDLREFLETLRIISVSSLYFHVYESRLRLGRAENDFSFWLQNSMDESELAAEIGRVDPYTYTLEGLRSALIHLIEKRAK
jgi:small-conductance mechanosensitive channel